MLFKSNSSETGVGTCLIFSHHPTKKGIHFLQQIVVQVVWIKNCKFLDLFSKFKSSHLVRWFPTNKFIYREFPIFSQVFPMISREILRPPPSSRGFHPASAARRGRRSWKPAVVTTAVVTGNSENHGENHIIYKFQCLLPHVVRYFAIIYIYTYHRHCCSFTINVGGLRNGPGVCGLLTREELEHLPRGMPLQKGFHSDLVGSNGNSCDFMVILWWF
jgi:hypothetical protein